MMWIDLTRPPFLHLFSSLFKFGNFSFQIISRTVILFLGLLWSLLAITNAAGKHQMSLTLA